jgi:hypothetical protein
MGGYTMHYGKALRAAAVLKITPEAVIEFCENPAHWDNDQRAAWFEVCTGEELAAWIKSQFPSFWRS